MPKIPEGYKSQVGIATGRALTVTPGAVDTRGVSGAIKDVGSALLEAERNMIRVRDFRETNEAMNFVYDKSRAIKSLSNEDDGFDPTRYYAELNNTVSDAAKNITSPLAKEEFIFKAQRQVDAVGAGIRDSFRTREIRAGQASYGYQKKMASDTVGAMSEAETLTAIDGIRHTLSEGTAAGLWNKDYEDYEIQTFQKDVADAQANYHVITNPEAAKAELEAGEEGAFAALPAEDRARHIKNADTRIATLIREGKMVEARALIDRRYEIIDMIATRKIDLSKEPDTIRNMYGVDGKLAEAMHTVALEGKPIVTENNEAFLAAAEDMFKAGNEKQISNFIVNALKNPNISMDRLQSLAYGAQKKAEELRRGEKDGFWSGLFDFFKEFTKFGEMDTLITTLERSKQEGATNERTQEIANEEVAKERGREAAQYGFTQKDIEESAIKYGMSEDEVLEALKAKKK